MEYRNLSPEERQVFFIAALVPVNIRRERVADDKARYVGFADLLGAESEAERAKGLNLTAADYVIILDPWWNPAVENQAADRAHRIGQRRPVTIYRLIAKDTVEEKVMALHNEKRTLAADMLSDTGSSSVNSEVLMGLLQGPTSGGK